MTQYCVFGQSRLTMHETSYYFLLRIFYYSSVHETYYYYFLLRMFYYSSVHTTTCQPLDRTFLGRLKIAYTRKAEKIMVDDNPLNFPTQTQPTELFLSAYSRTASTEKADYGFRSPGFNSFSPNIYFD